MDSDVPEYNRDKQALRIITALRKSIDPENNKKPNRLASISMPFTKTDSRRQLLHPPLASGTKNNTTNTNHLNTEDPQASLRRIVDVPGAYISKAQEEALAAFDPTLTNAFNKYSKVVIGAGITPSIHNKSIYSDGPFLDLGQVPQGSKQIIFVEIINTATHEVEVDVVTKDFRSNHVTVSAFPRSFAPGLKTRVTVTFTAPSLYQNIIASIEVILRTKLQLCTRSPFEGTLTAALKVIHPTSIQCPVFFHVVAPRIASHSSSSRNQELELCNRRNLPMLLREYTGTPAELQRNFERRNESRGVGESTSTIAGASSCTSPSNKDKEERPRSPQETSPALVLGKSHGVKSTKGIMSWVRGAEKVSPEPPNRQTTMNNPSGTTNNALQNLGV
eukprot:gene184-185_t